jgi:hypothetical protein
MEDLRKLRDMGAIGEEVFDKTDLAVRDFQRGDQDALRELEGRLSRLITQESEFIKTPKHKKRPMAKNARKRARKNGAFI